MCQSCDNVVDMSNESERAMIPDKSRRVRSSPTSAELRAWRLFIETSSRCGTSSPGVCRKSRRCRPVITACFSRCRRVRNAGFAHLSSRTPSAGSAVGSHHLGRMERRDLVRRESVPGDSRGAEVVLTPVGAQLFRAGSAPHLRAIQEVFVRALAGAAGRSGRCDAVAQRASRAGCTLSDMRLG